MINVKQQAQKLGLSFLTVLTLSGIGATTVNAKSPARHHHIKYTRTVKVKRHKHSRKRINRHKKHVARKGKTHKRRARRHSVRKHRHHKRVQKRRTMNIGAEKGSVAQPASGPKKSSVSAKGSHQFNRMFKLGKSKLGTPYLLGAVGTHEFDCGSFTQYLYGKTVHKSMSRNAQVQYNEFKHVSEHNAKPGDLVFFGGSTRTIGHVGLYIGHGKMIDSQLRGVVIEHIHAPWWNAVGFARPANLK